MHRDVKLGLALGILLIGFAAAFCFPRRPIEDLAVTPVIGPKLALADREILERRVRSFVGEELDPGPEPTLAPEKTRNRPASLSEMFEPAEDAPLFQPVVTVSSPVGLSSIPAGSPVHEPIAAEWRPEVSLPPNSEALSTPEVAELIEPREYTVQPGDTLSRIASKTMGSATKYTALFEANREILRTPDSLKPGMVLTIPLPDQQVVQRGMNARTGGATSPQPEPIPKGAVRVARQIDEAAESARSPESAAARAGMFRKAGSLPFTTVRGSHEDE